MSITRRPAVLADAAALAAIYAAYDTAELGEPEMELSDIEGFLLIDGSDRIVMETEGRLVGYGDVGRSGEVETVVDPSYDGARDLQRELLAWAVDRARERKIGRIEHWAGTRADGAAVLLTEAGFTHARTMWRMERALADALPGPFWPSGVALREFDRDRDAQEVWQVVMTSFAGAHGSHHRPFEEWSTLVLGAGSGVICAVEGDAVIGVATVATRLGTGHVGQLAVLPSHRGRGVALALLHECFRRDAEAGLPATTLTVDGENATARRLYEKAGMRVAKEYRRWERDV